MASCSSEKGQTMTLLCIVMLFLMTTFIVNFSKIYKKTNFHINKIENKSFWDNQYEF